MRTICERCKSESRNPVGYCTCGGVRIVAEPLTDAQAEANSWTATPLLRSRIPGLQNVYLKYENGSLTGSFKDRIMRLTVADAMRSGSAGGVVPSSGNAALAASAAGARTGFPIFAIVPIGTARERILPVVARGATVIEAGSDPSEAYRAADLISNALKLSRLYSTFAAPLAEWACRMIGIEAARQLEIAPASVVAPISAGPVLVGTGNGIKQEAGSMPSLIGVQPEGCCPITKAFEEGEDEVRPWSGPVATSAIAIADRLTGYPQDGTFTLEAIRRTNGLAAAVSDEEMRAAREELLLYDGLDVELSGAAGVAWLMRAGSKAKEPIICVLTASGFKHTYSGDAPRVSVGSGEGTTAEKIVELVLGQGIRAQLIDLPR